MHPQRHPQISLNKTQTPSPRFRAGCSREWVVAFRSSRPRSHDVVALLVERQRDDKCATVSESSEEQWQYGVAS